MVFVQRKEAREKGRRSPDDERGSGASDTVEKQSAIPLFLTDDVGLQTLAEGMCIAVAI